MIKHRMLAPIRRNLFEPLDALRSGTHRLAYWKELEQSQFLTESTLKYSQWKKLNELLSYVWGKNKFYRERIEQTGMNLDMILSPADFMKIPVLTKEEIRTHTLQMISEDYDPNSLFKSKTGGSTGKSLEIFMTEKCSELRNACARRHDRWTGWEPGEPIGAVWGNPELPRDMKSKFKDWFLSPIVYLDTMSVNNVSVRSFAAEWNRIKPTLLYGHAHSLYVLAEYVKKLEISVINPKGILSTSMMLMPHERRLIESVFNVKVTDRYGCEEVSLIASECEMHEGMHLNIEHLFIEFIKEDGTPAATGEAGKIVVTDLMNKAMPFIRYMVEDVGVPTDKKCSCGRGLPLMEHVTGRIADFLTKKDGSKVAGVSLIENTLTKIPGIDQMQIIQKTLNIIMLNLVVNSLFDKDSEDGLILYFETLFCSDVDIRVNYTNAIAIENNGKYRFCISEI